MKDFYIHERPREKELQKNLDFARNQNLVTDIFPIKKIKLFPV